MWWSLVTEHHAATLVGFALGFAAQQKFDSLVQQNQLLPLSSNNIGQIVDNVLQVGDALFEAHVERCHKAYSGGCLFDKVRGVCLQAC